MKLPSTIRFANESLEDIFYKLKSGTHEEVELYHNLLKIFNILEKDAFSGIQLPKRLIPKEYVVKYNLDNLWKYNLPKHWRVVYSITKEDILIVSLILEWFSHSDYEKRFNY